MVVFCGCCSRVFVGCGLFVGVVLWGVGGCFLWVVLVWFWFLVWFLLFFGWLFCVFVGLVVVFFGFVVGFFVLFVLLVCLWLWGGGFSVLVGGVFGVGCVGGFGVGVVLGGFGVVVSVLGLLVCGERVVLGGGLVWWGVLCWVVGCVVCVVVVLVLFVWVWCVFGLVVGGFGWVMGGVCVCGCWCLCFCCGCVWWLGYLGSWVLCVGGLGFWLGWVFFGWWGWGVGCVGVVGVLSAMWFLECLKQSTLIVSDA
ncbi:hypothetical protein, partial [Pseudomonas syringae group genomosp. 7]|uniref:hypothetical protein n=1 Tax=Pseudomonas syringae group genomosp. 7 TaxID=251699 RepID=UPI0037704083